MTKASLAELIGKTCSNVENIGSTEIRFTLTTGEQYSLSHDQECCERVFVEDVVGDLSDLVGSPILMSEVVSSETDTSKEYAVWTFYKFATRKGYVDMRWYGESNGYYSVTAEFYKL
jgi:hypothetical protein